MEKVYLQLTLNSHQEDHDGYCSGADIDVEDEEITMIMSIDFKKESRLDRQLEIIESLPKELNRIIIDYLFELPDELTHAFESRRTQCNETPDHEDEFGDLQTSSRSHYCRVEPSFVHIEDWKLIEKKEYDQLNLLPYESTNIDVPKINHTDYKIISSKQTKTVETEDDKRDKLNSDELFD